jgi:predicted nucleic acid-binding protein
MPPNSEIIISDTSCLILLAKIDELDLLRKIGKRVLITPEIYQEFRKSLPDWIIVKEPSDRHFQNLLEREVDKGEASAIILALETFGSILLIDDLKGRKVAAEMGLKHSGTFGLILRAKQEGLIEGVRPIIEKIRNTNFRFSEELLQSILDQAGELNSRSSE